MSGSNLFLRLCRKHVRGALAAFALGAVAVSSASAQNEGTTRPGIRDLLIGEPISAQPTNFQEFACGTNGGPPSLPIGGFADFAQCPAEETGLHEVQFRYDDELYYRALAAQDALRADFLKGTKIGDFPILASALIDDAGILRGVRAVTDDRVDTHRRSRAFGMAEVVQSLYGAVDWVCTDIAPEEGETPVGNRLVKQDCSKMTDDGLLITTQSRLLHRPGQTLVDPANGLLRPDLFISTARMEIYQVDADGNPIYGTPGVTAAATTAETPAPTDPREAFLAGFSNDCPGCDLAGADLKRRDLAGADLSGADLSGATLHRAKLGGANFDGANLRGANLNVADVKRASFVGADLTDALLYQTDAAAADFSQAILDHTVFEYARFTNATMVGVHWQNSIGLEANLAGADLTGAILSGTAIPQADLQRANLTGADLTDVSFFQARLRGADLSEVTALRADFLQANLTDAVFVNADLTDARLLRASDSGIDLTGAILTNTIMPDGTVGQGSP
jgi:uncharacterized protein YjbI with pentapeptide repeats